ncbi:MAG: hypothetical protein L0312_26225, partial [Acidobacteria bacterium]|nr:hypothetical protein [Acidobacteriota bacterium]
AAGQTGVFFCSSSQANRDTNGSAISPNLGWRPAVCDVGEVAQRSGTRYGLAPQMKRTATWERAWRC